MNRPTAGQIEERSLEVSLDGRRIRGSIPYNTLSADMGGWRERIAPDALRGAVLDGLTAKLEHQGLPLARHPGTLALEDRADAMRWSFEPPRSRQDIIEAVERGDLRGASFRMKVARDSWNGDTRTVEQISELRDVSLVADPSYPSASVELRSKPETEGHMPEDNTPAVAPTAQPEQTPALAAPPAAPAPAEDRSAPPPQNEPPRPPAGSLRVEDRTSANPRQGLADEFRARGFPDQAATIDWKDFESRAITWTPSMDLLNQRDNIAGAFPFDQRYAWPALESVAVDAATTSILTLTQTARTLAAGTVTVRAIDSVVAKPETASTVNLVTVPMKQVATIQTGVPNIVLAQPAINSIIERDLTLAINEGLDKLMIDTIAASGFQTLGSNLILTVRSAMTTLFAAGYNPDTLILTPADAAALDVLTSGIAGGTADFVFSPGTFAPNIWNLTKRVSKTVPASVVMDSRAYGKMYMGPVSLQVFENLSGTTNSGNVRLELSACCGLERQAAAIRLAAS